ncbi:CHAT domain-containing protein [Spirosoma foliorum]|uniref:CHAT domain-containing protein n=1 Tax=Spirosoma foliorum TaxID=2710596 RepID=A0A7G5GRK0_9BACT|nr:CHAT domain-containing protein [Spirosoma foliorum]QMW01492.1 CHAT domain-containing protein [Spirosoma foliorum]
MDKFLTIKLTLSDYPGTADKFISRIDVSPLGASPGQGCVFTLPIILSGITSFEAYFKTLINEPKASQQLKELGISLFKCIFQDGVRDKWNNILGLINYGQSNKLRIAFNILSEKLVNIPWELLHDGNDHLLRIKRISIVRVIDELVAPKKAFGPITHPLLIVANPGGYFNADEHIENIYNEFVQANILESNINVLKDATKDNIFEFLQQHRDGDFLYFLGHGGLDENEEGVILLQSDTNQEGENLEAARLAEGLNDSNIRFVYFNSCSTGVSGSGTFSGVGQKIMLRGDVVSVIAMQAPISAQKGMDIAKLFIRKIMQIETIEVALSSVRNQYVADSFTWAIPIIYTYLQGPEDFEKNQVLSLLGSLIREETYALCIPSFKETLLEEEISSKGYKAQINVNGNDVNNSEYYHYPGLSFAQSDIKAANYITNLLLMVTSYDNIKLLKGSAIQEETASKCIFLFGSRSNVYVSQVLNGYSPTFRLYYNKKEWYIIDKGYNKKYSINPPDQQSSEQWDAIADYCCIQKIIATSKVYFLISGLGDRGTIGGCWWFIENWKFLLREAGTGEFRYLLRLPTSIYSDIEIVTRENNEWGQSIDE